MNSGILICCYRALVTVTQRYFHVQTYVQLQPKEVRTEGLQREYQLGRKLLRSSLINDQMHLSSTYFCCNQLKPMRIREVYLGYNKST